MRMTDAVQILVIDDSEDDRALYRRALKKADARYEIIEADDGDQGLALIDDEFTGCVLLDYSLPGRNGIEVLKRLRAKHAFVPVVMLTGQGNETLAVAAMQEGAQNYIAKSAITAEDIHCAIQLAIAHCAMGRRIHEQRQALEIFTRALAHDLKEPVRTIRSYLALIGAQEELSDKGRGYFAYVSSAADRMAALIDAVYYYTRLDGAPPQVAKQRCDVAAILDEARADLAALLQERGGRITAGALGQVDANPLQLRQVLQNLVCNAIVHGAAAGPCAHVEIDQEADHWVVRVADNGPGVEEATRERIFEPFTRLGKQASQGLGMGLAICRRIVETHGGRLWCEPGPSGGAVFVFTLPIESAVACAGAPSPAADARAPAAEAGDARLANVLVVDDNEAAIDLTRIILVESGKLRCRLLSAASAEDALEHLLAAADAGQPIDIVLLDINMPCMDGFEMLDRMRTDAALSGVPVVMCTTSSYDKDMERARALGAVGYVTKPPEPDALKPILSALSHLRFENDATGGALFRFA
jgi:signal transduction histidine kinase